MLNPFNRIKTGLSAATLIKRTLDYLLPLCCAFAVALYIGNICSYETVIEASVNGVPCGYIQSRESFDSAIMKVENRIYTDLGSEYGLDCNVTYSFTHAKNPVYLTGSDCEAIVQFIADRDYCEGYMLYVDDVQAAAYSNYDGIKTLIGDIEADLLASCNNEFSSVVISNRLRIEKQLCPRSYLKSLDEINTLLNPLAAAEDKPAALARTAARDVSPMRVSAFAALAPNIDTDVEYGVVRTGDDADSAPDLTLSYTFVRSETVDEVIYNTTEYIDDYDNYVGTDTVIEEGQCGYRTVTYEISCDADGSEVGRTELESSIIYPAVDRIVMVGAVEIPDAVPTGTFIWPCDTSEGISSGYGGRDLYGSYDFHLGIDLPGDDGDAICASDGGEVIWAGFTPSYGYSIRIQHNDNYITLYAHMRKLLVAVGDKVFQGQQIGEMGHTGAAYGTHLHFEVRTGSLTVNPVKYLPKLGS